MAAQGSRVAWDKLIPFRERPPSRDASGPYRIRRTMETTPIPRWNLDVVYPSLQSAEFAHAKESVLARLTSLEVLYDEMPVRKGATCEPERLERIRADAARFRQSLG